MVFFLFCILVDRPMEGGYSPGYATLRSDANQSQISGGDADVDHTQIIGGIYPPRVSAPLVASRLDRFYVTASINPESCFISDHSLVGVTVTANQSQIFVPGYWQNNVTLYDHVSCVEFIQKH